MGNVNDTVLPQEKDDPSSHLLGGTNTCPLHAGIVDSF
jgi:hypothetical protein